MHDTLITVQGYAGGDVTVRSAADSTVATFRLACTPRRFDRRTETWVDGVTQWYTVNAWRSLGDHVAQSVHRGHPVFVHGRLRASTWTGTDGVELTSQEIDATVVGHDLARGTTVFSRPVRASETAREQEVAPAAA